jgi:predicted RNA-binding Zn-ribbon protein involved in translation (DUF1610 family)
VGDAVVIWDKKTSIGASVIESITTGTETKTLKKCPHCGKAGIKIRKKILPAYKCYKCGGLFDEPKLVVKNVTTFESRHDIAWVDLDSAVPGPTLRRLCEEPGSQHSMRPFRWDDFTREVAELGLGPVLDAVRASTARILGGHKERTVRVRVGQHQFRKTLVDKYGPVCAFTGLGPLPTLEAGHLYSYAESGEHHSDGGWLLRRDVHRLFDLGFLAVNPQSFQIDVHPTLDEYPMYQNLHGQQLHVKVTQKQHQWLVEHWNAHRIESDAGLSVAKR